MKTKIMLTIITICVTIMLAGCKNGNQDVDNGIDIDNNSFNSGEVIEVSSGEERVEENIVPQIEEEVYKYNESGKIIIVMYHKFADIETDEYSRSFENFRKDLEYLYELGYRTISLTDYLENDIKVPVGCTPIVLTFDDGTKGQFNLIKSGETFVSNPKSAVGIMEEFYKEHPDFGLNGTFYINGSSFFTGEGTEKERLEYLLSKGFEIGNHTNTHVYFNKASSEQIQKEIGTVNNLVDELTGYKITSLALPFGISSKEYADYINKGIYEGQEYENKIILLVGASPAPNPNSEKLNLLRLPRVRARGGNKAVECDLYYWLEVMEKNPSMKYVRLSNDSGEAE